MRDAGRAAMTTVLKLGGELLDDAVSLQSAVGAIRLLAAREDVIVVHGGGRAIDAELRSRGLEPRFADGLRITDAAALEAVLSVLAGRNNTVFVAALQASGLRAVGLTGADAAIGLSRKADAMTTSDGTQVDLGLVGQPIGASVTLLQDLIMLRYLPVIASIGLTEDGTLLNVNADTFAGHVAGALGARRLIIAGATAGVLDRSGRTIRALALEDVDAMIASGEAHSGMVAKLIACRSALAAGVPEVAIVSGRGAANFDEAEGTRVLRVAVSA